MGRIEDENIRRLESMYDAFKRGDMAAVVGMFGDEMDLDVVGPATVPFAGRFQGRAAIEEFFAIVAEHLDRHPEDPTPVVHEMIAQGDKVVALGVDRVRSKATGCITTAGGFTSSSSATARSSGSASSWTPPPRTRCSRACRSPTGSTSVIDGSRMNDGR